MVASLSTLLMGFVLQANVFNNERATDDSSFCLETWGRRRQHLSVLFFWVSGGWWDFQN